VNVEGYDAGSYHYGNKSYIYVNTSSVINGLSDSIFRSLFIAGSADNGVEVGWTANNGGHSGPTVYAEWVNRGVDSGPKFYTGYSLSTDTSYRFFVENVGHIQIFRFLVDGQSSPFKAFIAENNATAAMGQVNGQPALVIEPNTDAPRSNPAWVEFNRNGIDINVVSSSYGTDTLLAVADSMQ